MSLASSLRLSPPSGRAVSRIALALLAGTAFATAAAFAVVAAVCSLSIHDADAAETMVRRGRSKAREGSRTVAVTQTVA